MQFFLIQNFIFKFININYKIIKKIEFIYKHIENDGE